MYLNPWMWSNTFKCVVTVCAERLWVRVRCVMALGFASVKFRNGSFTCVKSMNTTCPQ